MDPSQIVDNSLVSLASTATLFGQGALASAISGNPFYSQDPAAANIATTTGVVGTTTSALGGSTGILILAAVALYFVFKR